MMRHTLRRSNPRHRDQMDGALDNRTTLRPGPRRSCKYNGTAYPHDECEQVVCVRPHLQEFALLEISSAGPKPPPPDALPRWHGDGLLARSIRFTLVVMAPIATGIKVGPSMWLAYGLLTCILGYLVDTGGPAPLRFVSIVFAGAVVLAGAGLGTLVSGSTVLIALAVALTGLIYGLVESSHHSIAVAARFLCLSLAFGALYVPLRTPDALSVAAFVVYTWVVSIAWDAATGMWRPAAAPLIKELLARLRATPVERWVFASVVAGAAAAAFLVSKALHLEHPNWAILSIVVVLREDSQLSRRLAIHLVLGTLVGVAAALAYGFIFTSAAALMIGMAIAVLVRWPAQQVSTALGLAAMAAFVILLLQLVALIMGTKSHAPLERLVDVTLGCVFALAAIWINEVAQKGLHRKPV